MSDELINTEHIPCSSDLAVARLTIDILTQENVALKLHNEQCKAVVAALIDVYDVVLPYKVLQKGRALLGRAR